MIISNIFIPSVLYQLEKRIGELKSDTKPLWGKMKASQMFAHCSVNFEIALNKNVSNISIFKKLYIKILIKPSLINNKAFDKNIKIRQNLFYISNDRDFEIEKIKLIDFLYQIQKLGEIHFSNRCHADLGDLTIEEWNNLFYKHLDHHLCQFGV